MSRLVICVRGKIYNVFYEGKIKGGYSYHCAYIKTGKGTVISKGYSDEKGHAEENAIKIMNKKYKKTVLEKISKTEKGLILEVVRFDNNNKGYKNLFLVKIVSML